MTTVLIPLAEGVEEMEAVIVIDVLRRAGFQVMSAAVTPAPIRASRGVQLLADAAWEAVRNDARGDALVLPGGAGGTDTLCATPSVLETVRRYHAEGKLVAAICAAPLVLQAAGILRADTRATCHPGVAAKLTACKRMEEKVVKDGRILTSQGPGTAFAFALAIVDELAGPAAREALLAELILAP